MASETSASMVLAWLDDLSPHSTHPLLCVAADGRVLRANAVASTLLAAERTPDAWRETIQNALTAQHTLEFEQRQGAQVFRCLCIPVPAEQCVVIYGVDITTLVRAANEAQVEHAFALQIMDNMGQGLTVTDAERKFEYVNPAYAQMLGYKPEELIGKSPALTTFPEDYQRVAQVLTQRPDIIIKRTYETRLKRADGSAVPVLFSGVPRVRDGQIVGTIAVVTDLSQQKKTEAQIAQQNRELAQARDAALEASRLKSEFLATMSHEIRTPMNAIIGMTEILRESQLSDTQREYTSVIADSANALLDIINSILDFSKIEAGKMTIEHIDYEPLAVIESAAEMLAVKAREKKLSLMTYVAAEVPSQLKGDPTHLRQVLLNLVGNALKFTDKGEVTVRARVASSTATHVTLGFAISDTGIGLSPQARKRLFQPFTQADGSTTRKYGGTGLGLTISKRLVEMMGGTIGVDSVEGKGSTFWFTCQCERAPIAEAKPLAHLALLRDTPVLVVDDNRSNRDIIHNYLNAWDMKSATAHNGNTALAALRQAASENKPFQIAVVDMALPDMDGFALMRAIKREPSLARLRVIMLTAFDEWGQGEQALMQGFSAYLTKPVKQATLIKTIAHVLNKARTGYLRETGRLRETTGQLRTAQAQTIAIAPTGLQLLVAEDNPANQQLVTLQLEKLGYTVKLAKNGIEAVSEFLQNGPDYAAILMDCQMPELDGFQATRAIRQHEPAGGRRMPIIAMTANALKGDQEACLAAGMDDYISKPVTLDTLQKTLSRWTKTETPEPPSESAEVLDLALTPLPAEAELATRKETEPLDPLVIESLRALQSPQRPHLLADLIEVFLNETPPLLVALRNAAQNDDAKKLYEAAHNLKGMSSSLGAMRLAAFAKAVEVIGRSNTTQGAAEWLAKINGEYQRVKHSLAGVLWAG
jgi:PAS domain S-box-containing protein